MRVICWYIYFIQNKFGNKQPNYLKTRYKIVCNQLFLHSLIEYLRFKIRTMTTSPLRSIFANSFENPIDIHLYHSDSIRRKGPLERSRNSKQKQTPKSVKRLNERATFLLTRSNYYCLLDGALTSRNYYFHPSPCSWQFRMDLNIGSVGKYRNSIVAEDTICVISQRCSAGLFARRIGS